jgi:hypothetical protein
MNDENDGEWGGSSPGVQAIHLQSPYLQQKRFWGGREEGFNLWTIFTGDAIIV